MKLHVQEENVPPSVSVIMAAYNAERTIETAIRSILLQRDVSVELVICDDCSTDATRDVVRSFDDARIRLLENPVNMGPGPSRDRAIASASAPWLAMVDADDALEPERLALLTSAGEASGCQVIFDDTLLCHDTPQGIAPWVPLHGQSGFGAHGSSPRHVPIEDYITSNRLLIHPIIRTDFVREHRIRHGARRFAEDAEFHLRLAMAGARFCYLPRPLYRYRISPGSLTAQARNPALMRECLEECSRWEGWWPSARHALHRKIASLRGNEALYELADALRGRKFSNAAKIVASRPGILCEIPSRVTRRILYLLDRRRHRGYAR